SIPITLFWIIGITNTLNLIDGLDGLAVGVAMISSISLILVASKLGNTQVVTLAAIMSGACLGFLPFNFNPARIFMGDTGALFLGFMLASISIEGVMKSVATISIMVPIFILALPIFDTTFAICRRILNRKPITAGDKSHLHHRLIGTGYSQRDTVLILYSISIIFGNFSVLVVDAHRSRTVLISMILVTIAIIIALRRGMFNDGFK